ncbi:TolB-like translocation protein [Flavobacterium soli]|uniref:hypothetical protein n=1 Tax=Flavobacterium soli TaxID=344881 RepID=UPI0004286DB2|nr:hypothetical protein [Flavobacterium soli]
MKTITTFFKICFAVIILSMVSCSSDDSGEPNLPEGPVNTGELKLFAIDTAKVNSISVMGTNEQTVLNKLVNSSSYIADFCLSPDGTQFIYVNHQMEGTVPNLVFIREIRKANIDGSGDVKLYEIPDNEIHIGKIKFCSDGKIFFGTYTNFPNVTRNLHLMNADGTGLTDLNWGSDVIDVSDNREYYLVNTSSGPQILDADADNGMPGLYHAENMSIAETIEDGVFTADGKFVVIPYKEGNAVKARIIDMATKTSETMPLISGLGTGWSLFHLEMASDGKRGVITIAGADYTKSKTYVFNIETGVVEAPFENNDENIFDVYAF